MFLGSKIAFRGSKIPLPGLKIALQGGPNPLGGGQKNRFWDVSKPVEGGTRLAGGGYPPPLGGGTHLESRLGDPLLMAEKIKWCYALTITSFCQDFRVHHFMNHQFQY